VFDMGAMSIGAIDSRISQLEAMLDGLEATSTTRTKLASATPPAVNTSQTLPPQFASVVQAQQLRQNGQLSQLMAQQVFPQAESPNPANLTAMAAPAMTATRFSTSGLLAPANQPLPPIDLTSAAPLPSILPLKTNAFGVQLSTRAKIFQPMVDAISSRHNVDKDLVNALITQESGFNPAAVSRTGARGLMQLMPATAKDLGVQNPHDPVQNMDGGVRLLKRLLGHFRGNIPLALAAYNAGPGAVERYHGVPPYKETQQYVRNILATYMRAKQATT
jgi:soluble lytic murein transglycosylase-like protein